MNKQELAKELYEAYCTATDWKSAVIGSNLPQYDMCPAAVQKGWKNAAQRVIDMSVGNAINIVLSEGIGPHLDTQFVEIETPSGKSCTIGTRFVMDGGHTGLRITVEDIIKANS